MKASKLIPFVISSLKLNKPIIITGEPGLGKTSEVEQAVSQLKGYKLYTRHPVCMEPIDFRGMPCLMRDNEVPHAEFVPYGDMLTMINADSPVVFFYDDVGQTSVSVQKAMMALMLAREINGKKISDHVRFICATNRRGDNAGVGKMITPLISRQKSIITFTLDVDDWIAWAHDNNMPPILIAFIHFRGRAVGDTPSMLLNFDPNKVDESGNDLIQQPCPRTVANFGEWLNEGYCIKKDREVFVGCIGEEFVREFSGFVSVYDELGSLPQDIASGKDVPTCPQDPSTLYALASCLAHKSGDANAWSNISKWCRDKMPREFQQVVLLDAECAHKDKIHDTSEYVEWVTEIRKEDS